MRPEIKQQNKSFSGLRKNIFRNPAAMEQSDLNKEQKEVLENLNEAKKEIDIAYQNFEYVTDPDLIDSYIYELKALQLKYQYYLKLAKDMNLMADIGLYETS